METNLHGSDPSHLTNDKYLSSLRFILLPLAVMLLANIIFELIAFDIDALISELMKILNSGPESPDKFIETRLRLMWGTTLFIFYSALIFVSIFSIGIVRRSLSVKGQIFFATAGALVAVFVLGHLFYSAQHRNNFSYIFFFTFETLTASNHYTPQQLTVVKTLVSVLNVLSSLVPILTLLAGCCALSHERESHKPALERLTTQMRRLKVIISCGSFLLVAGILHMIAWLRWPAGLMVDPLVTSNVVNFSEAVGLYWGATFSLTMAAFYIPIALNINRQAESTITANPDQSKGLDPKEWLQKQGLSIAPLQQLPQVAVMLAPLLAGTVGSTLTNLSGTFTAG